MEGRDDDATGRPHVLVEWHSRGCHLSPPSVDFSDLGVHCFIRKMKIQIDGVMYSTGGGAGSIGSQGNMGRVGSK